MKAYKGFNKDMTCRGFQYEEGKEYHEEKAEKCKCGFHGCENPLDCFRYYSPATSVYHEVEIDEIDEIDESPKEENDDSRICGKNIKIGARLSVGKICELHFEYVKSKTTNSEQGKNNANLAAQNRSSLAAQDRSSLAARTGSSLAAQDGSSLAAQDGSSLAAQDWSSLAARTGSSLAAQDGSSLAAQNRSSLAAQDRSSLAARTGSSLAAQDWSSLAAQDWSSLAAGENSVIAAFNSKAKGGLNTLIALANREWQNGKYKITDFKAAIVDGDKIKADTWYKLENGNFVEVKEDNE